MPQTRAFARLDVPAARRWLAEHPDALVLDARDAANHAAARLPGARRLDGRNHETLLVGEPRQRPVFVYCYHGNASQAYAQMFADFGFHTVADLVGGHEAWARAKADDPSAPTSPWLANWLRLRHFANVDARGPHGNTPLMHAAWKGDVAAVNALLAAGADTAAANDDGNTALWLACVADHAPLVRALVAAGLDPDHANATGATCLMYAASSGKAAIVRTLLELGADPTLQSQDGFTALDMAATLDCLRLLRTPAATRGL
jgi:rhodanese-related sulfurtransferase